MQTLDLSAIDIASFVTKFCALNNYFINITKLQKLVYCCYGVVLAAQDTRLCKEHPKTWPHGPVFLNTLNDISNRNIKVKDAVQFMAECPKEWLEWIGRTIKAFWDYSDKALVKWSIRPGTPWFNTDPLTSLDDREIGIWFKQFEEIVWDAK